MDLGSRLEADSLAVVRIAAAGRIEADHTAAAADHIEAARTAVGHTVAAGRSLDHSRPGRSLGLGEGSCRILTCLRLS